MGSFPSKKNIKNKINDKTHYLYCNKFFATSSEGAAISNTTYSFNVLTIDLKDVVNVPLRQWSHVKSFDGKKYLFWRNSKNEGLFCCAETLIVADDGTPVGPQHEFKILLK